MDDLTTSTDVDTFLGSADQAAMRTNMGLGTAATSDVGDFATAAQGALADSAVQPGDLGTAAYQNTTAFATAAQGVKADNAIPKIASSTDNAIVRFDGAGGQTVQNSGITISDTDQMAGVDSMAFDTAAAVTLSAQGQMAWNATEETVDVLLNSFTMHTGQHVLYHAKNSTGSTIAKGTPVMFAGTNGASGTLLIQPWNGTGPSNYFMGLTGEEFLDTEEGFVVSFGKLRGIQTNGANYGETWVSGDIIYADTTTGSLTKTAPAAPNPKVTVCAVVSAHATNGTLFVRPTLGSNIKDDEGVTITSLSSGQVLVANGAGTVFENKSVSGDATLASTGALTIANDAVTYAKMQNVSAASRLLGRGSASGSGDPQEISLGSGLSMSGTTLSATASGGGKILQVVQATKTDTASVTGTTFSSVFTASITPSATTSKVLVMAMIHCGQAASQAVLLRLTKSGSTLLQGDAAGNRTRITGQSYTNQAGGIQGTPINYLDSPSSTSALTYEIEMASSSTGAVYLNRSATDTDTAAFSRAASTIILMEVGA